jgi:hypothetical protein
LQGNEGSRSAREVGVAYPNAALPVAIASYATPRRFSVASLTVDRESGAGPRVRRGLRLDETDYPMTAGECAVWPSSHTHAIRNDSDEPARAIGLVTEAVY